MLVSPSLPLDPQTAAVGIGRAVGAIGIAGAKGIVDGVWGERRAVAAVGLLVESASYGLVLSLPR